MEGLSASRLPSYEPGIHFQVSYINHSSYSVVYPLCSKSHLCNSVVVQLNLKNVTAASSSVCFVQTTKFDQGQIVIQNDMRMLFFPLMLDGACSYFLQFLEYV